MFTNFIIHWEKSFNNFKTKPLLRTVYHCESLQSKDTFLNGTTEVLWQLLVTLKNKKATSEVASKLLQECEKIWKKRINLCTCKAVNSSWSQIFHVICQTRCMAWVSLVFIDDVTTDRRSRMNCEVYMAIVYSDSAKCCKTGQTTHTKAAQNQLNAEGCTIKQQLKVAGRRSQGRKQYPVMSMTPGSHCLQRILSKN